MNKLFTKKNKNSSISIHYKYKRLKIIFFIFILFFSYTIYFNFDYIVFKFLIAGNYMYTDTLDEIYSEEINEKEVKNYFKNFDDVIISIFTKKIHEKNNDNYTFIYSPKQFKNHKKNSINVAKKSHIEKLTNDVIYLKLTNFSNYSAEFIYDNKEELKKFKHIIIDLRGNKGGNLLSAYKIAELFLDRNLTICYEDTRNPLFSSNVKTKSNQHLKYDNIFILQDEQTASSSEVLINALKYNLDNVILVGKTTFGKGIGQVELYLKNGYVLKATTICLRTPEEISINKLGIKPDIEYDKNDIIEYTINLIK